MLQTNNGKLSTFVIVNGTSASHAVMGTVYTHATLRNLGQKDVKIVLLTRITILIIT